MKYGILILGIINSLTAAEPEQVIRGHVFAWPFIEAKEMQPRGGTTQGTSVTLDTKPSETWAKLQERSSSKLEKDRRAILAMTGSYRVSFDFMETMGFTQSYQPAKPYFSWGTEHVQVLQDKPKSISIQHTLVMYFKNKEGKELGPLVMKHWRQDWNYEDTNLHAYRGKSTWSQTSIAEEKIHGKWTQAVFQVDDSPRYETTGEWIHQGGMSTWRSDSCWRPLPRREFAVRDDYNILQGTHQITITPTGWVHTQQNQKVLLDGNHEKIIAQELGVNRYERITSPSLKQAEITWNKTHLYWNEVRKAWGDVYTKHPTFSLKAKVEDKKLFEYHFEYAASLEKKEDPVDLDKAKAHAKETIHKFLITEGTGTEDKY